MKRILIIDNYDSFTFNLVQYVEEVFTGEVVVIKNDKVELDKLQEFSAMIISPGPGLPEESGRLMKVFEHIGDLPVLGVCLGHQAIGEFFGARLEQLETVYHGIDSVLTQESSDYRLFRNMDENFRAGRYHSWVIDENSLAGTPLEITCRDKTGIIMGVSHQSLPIHGVQFHPESVMTPDGRRIISNFISTIEEK